MRSLRTRQVASGPAAGSPASSSSSSSDIPDVKPSKAILEGFDPINTVYASKEAFITKSNLSATKLGFRLYIGGERQRPRAKSVEANRLELSCHRFRHMGPDGKRTRVDGCHFALRARQIYDPKVPPNERKWELAAGTFEHNHELGPPIPLPKRRKARGQCSPEPEPPAKRQRSSELLSIRNSTVPHVDPVPKVDPALQPAVESLLDLAAVAYPSPADTPSPSLDPDSSRPLGSQITDSELISVLSDLANGGSGVWATFPPAPPATAVGAEAENGEGTAVATPLSTFEAALAALTSLPSPAPLPPLPVDTTSVESLASPVAIPSIASSPAPTTIFTDPLVPPVDESSSEEDPLLALFASLSPLAAITNFLRDEHPDLEQYAAAFLQAGCPDLDTLLRLSDADMKTLIEEDLPRLVPTLQTMPFHVRLLSTIMAEEKERRKLVETFLGQVGKQEHDLELDLVAQLDLAMELGMEMGMGGGMGLELDVGAVKVEEVDDFEGATIVEGTTVPEVDGGSE